MTCTREQLEEAIEKLEMITIQKTSTEWETEGDTIHAYDTIIEQCRLALPVIKDRLTDMGANEEALGVIQDVYAGILAINPSDPFRVFNQKLYCRLRDFISKSSGLSAETIQDIYEEKAASKALEAQNEKL